MAIAAVWVQVPPWAPLSLKVQSGMATNEGMGDITFPVFRKYADERTYFKIHSYSYFEEIKTMGGFYETHTYQAQILPDRNLIEDMIQLRDQFWEIASKEEFDSFKAYCEEHLQPLNPS